MNIKLLLSCLSLSLALGFPAWAEEGAPAPEAAPAPAAAEDPLKDIVIHQRPADFDAAQKLALQNRDERLTMLNASIECVKNAKTMEDLGKCQQDERKMLDKIWLSYCDTTISFTRTGNKNARGQKFSECDRALAAVTGKPLAPKTEEKEPAAE